MDFSEDLMSLFRGWLRSEALKWRGIPGMQTEDFEQIGWIGLWEATQTYQPERGPFPAWAYRVMRKRMVDAARGATREKHRMLNTATDWDVVGFIGTWDRDDEDKDFDESNLWRWLWSLSSPVERQVLTALREGLGITQGAQALGISRKRFDNALQRLRRKARLERQVS